MGKSRAERTKVRILLAEDNDDDIILIREAFKDTRLARLVTVVKDGAETMACLRREGPFAADPLPSLVLLDLNMPRMDGYEVLRTMKASPDLRSIPVVVLTTSRSTEDMRKCYAEGACSYITKAGRFNDFRHKMKQLALYWGLVASLPAANPARA
ncbi:MAG: response regulator [Nitrospirae bacterium]|nr:response regulator [Nitrospirota bacterium]